MTEKKNIPIRAGRPVDRRKDIDLLAAARALVFSEGPQALTMARVAEQAGISKVTLYSRYANRDELLQAVVTSYAHTVAKELLKPPSNMKELRCGLISFVEALSKFVCSLQHQRLLQAMSVLSQQNQDFETLYQSGPAKTHQLLTTYLQEATEVGLIQCSKPEVSAEILQGMLMGLDLVRSIYRVPIGRQGSKARKAHAVRIVEIFIALHTTTH